MTLRNGKGGFMPFGQLEEKGESELNRSTRVFFTEHVERSKLTTRKNPQANLRLQYRRVFEWSLGVTLALAICLFQVARQFGIAPPEPSTADIKIEVADIPVTEQFRQPPPPSRPSVPLPTEDESVPDDLTIASTEIDLTELPPPPPPMDDDDEIPIFVAYDEPPQIVGGIAALQKYLEYPKLAAKAGIEGTVFVNVLVGVDGSAQACKVIRARPAEVGFEEAAVNALKSVKWKPAKQRDRAIRCWISIPVKFQLVG